MPLRPNVRALLLLDEKGVVPSVPPDAFVKFEVVVKEEEEGLDRDDRAGSHGRDFALLLRDCAGWHRWERAPTLRRRRGGWYGGRSAQTNRRFRYLGKIGGQR